MGADPGGRAGRDVARGGRVAARPDRGARCGHDRRRRQAADRESRRGWLDGRRVRLLRRDRAGFRRPGDPLDRGDAAGPRRQGSRRPRRLHRAVELPAASALVEAGARACRRQRDGLQAVRADPALDPGHGRLVRAPAGRRGEHPCRRRRRRCRDRRGRAHRLRRLHRVGGHGQEDRGGVRRPGGPDQPRDGRQGPVHRLLRRRGEDRCRGARGRMGGVPQRGAGLHLGRALLRDGRRLRRLPDARSPRSRMA